MRLSASQLRRAFDFLDKLRDCQTLDAFATDLVHALPQLIDCDLIGYNEIAPRHGRLHAIVSADYPNHREIEAAWTRHQSEHPTFQHYVRTGDPTAWRVSDFLTRREFHDTGIYQNCYRLLGAEAQMSLSLDAPPGVVVALAFNRGHGDFTQGDRDLMNLVRPHLSRAYNRALNAAELTHRAGRATAALEALGDGVVAVAEDGRTIAWSTARGRALLAGAFADAIEDALPPRVRAWLAATTPGDGEPLVVPAADAGGAARVAIYLLPGGGGGADGERLLLLAERRPLPTNGDGLARALKLTAREADVLLALMGGHATPEIARAFGCAPRTVEKHVENLLRKLDVTTRAAAVARAMQALNDAR